MKVKNFASVSFVEHRGHCSQAKTTWWSYITVTQRFATQLMNQHKQFPRLVGQRVSGSLALRQHPLKHVIVTTRSYRWCLHGVHTQLSRKCECSSKPSRPVHVHPVRRSTYGKATPVVAKSIPTPVAWPSTWPHRSVRCELLRISGTGKKVYSTAGLGQSHSYQQLNAVKGTMEALYSPWMLVIISVL